MVTTNLNLTYTIVWSLALANVAGALLCLALAQPIARLTTIPFAKIAPFMIMVISFAAFQATRDMMDLWALLAFGALGMFMRRFGWSRPALVIGFVLAPQAEAYLNQAVQFYGWSMLSRPGVLVLMMLTVVCVYVSRSARVDEHGTHQVEPPPSRAMPWGQLLFACLVAALFIYAIYDGTEQSFLGGIFPIGIGAATLPFVGFIIVKILGDDVDHPVRFDAERLESAGEYRHGWLPALGAVAGLYALSAIIGFIPAIVVFFVGFLHFWARTSWLTIIIATAIATGLLLTFGHLLALEYPAGFLLPVFI